MNLSLEKQMREARRLQSIRQMAIANLVMDAAQKRYEVIYGKATP